MTSLYIIAGCNGAGKTTASFTVLPELLQVKEFVNADEIARGLSPFQPEKVSIEAGRIMLRRLQELMAQGVDFAFETTLATRSFVGLIDRAKALGYTITLIYYWLDSVELAVERVRARVAEGGHNIPAEVVARRYQAGLRNFLHLYKSRVDYWLLINNSQTQPALIAEGQGNISCKVVDLPKWQTIHQFTTHEPDRN
ncbi:zeta toxin family protein [Hymenobacter sp. UYCo722]|uniref:zeta toxin family protein n=1 Tax=Hymenobacter sp. UYCo722 TaxID=3156335 RepID=UPI003394B99B